MQVCILGCGTSTGVPLIGCNCNVCSSADPRNHRLRSSILLKTNGKSMLIDTSTDLRLQALNNGIERVDAVLFTHPHADHIHGIDEMRNFNYIQKQPVNLYGNQDTINKLKLYFTYIFEKNHTVEGGGIPLLNPLSVNTEFTIDGIDITPLPVKHGSLDILGYKIGNFAYITDCSAMPESTKILLKGIKVLILGALRYTNHPTHLNVDDAVKIIEDLKVERAFITHMGHELDYTQLNEYLPANIEPAYDSLSINI